MNGAIRIGIGGWTFEPWRSVFYPPGLAHKQELAFAARALTSIEINGTYYSRFKPATWRSWDEATPGGFVFSVKASRFTTNRRMLAQAGPSIRKFLDQGLCTLGSKLGPINWQFMASKKFDADDFAEFLGLLPKSWDGLPLRHALEVRHPSFACKAFTDLARNHGAAVVYAQGGNVPEIDVRTAGFTYARIMRARQDLTTGYTPAEITALAKRAVAWSKHGDVFCYFISGAKVHNPAAAQALMARLALNR